MRLIVALWDPNTAQIGFSLTNFIAMSTSTGWHLLTLLTVMLNVSSFTSMTHQKNELLLVKPTKHFYCSIYFSWLRTKQAVPFEKDLPQ
jgi:apolipoprotein N-acyltransferase